MIKAFFVSMLLVVIMNTILSAIYFVTLYFSGSEHNTAAYFVLCVLGMHLADHSFKEFLKNES